MAPANKQKTGVYIRLPGSQIEVSDYTMNPRGSHTLCWLGLLGSRLLDGITYLEASFIHSQLLQSNKKGPWQSNIYTCNRIHLSLDLELQKSQEHLSGT